MKDKKFYFTHRNLPEAEQGWEHFFSAIPGLMSWSILIGMVVLSFVRPLAAAIVVIAYDIYWLFRLFYMTIFMILAYGVLAIEKETDWLERCRILMQGRRGLQILREKVKASKNLGIRERLSFRNQERELQRVLARRVRVPNFESIYHVVIIAAAKETRQVIEPGLLALSHSQFPAKRILPVLAVEERSGKSQEKMAEALHREYGHHFFDFLVAVHPDGIEGEAKVKGANVTYAAKQVANLLTQKQIPFENVIVSCFDADTVASPEYFAALTYHFMRHPDRLRASYQPIPVYHNNIWEAPGFARVLEMGSSFFQLVEATNPEKLVTFSSHSMSFKALVEIGYWPVDMISDDSAIFWKALVHYGGDYRVIPMYVTLSMDVVMAGTIMQTLMTIYRQKRRWAWGVENFPVVMRAFLKVSGMSIINKFRYTLKLLEMHVSWATVGFLMTFIGWLPAFFAGREFSSSVLYYNSARITTLIFRLATAVLFITIILSLYLLPKKKTSRPILKRIVFAIEWLLVPLVFTFLSTMPALDAQTRLMLGKPLEFQVTEKKRRN